MIPEACKIPIHQQIEQGGSFAIYRLPGDNRIRYVGQDSGSVSVYTDIKALNKQCGFVIAPFCISTDYPIVLIQGEEEVWLLGEVSPVFTGQTSHPVPPVASNYAERFEIFTYSLKHNKLNKLVLSRSIERKREGSFSVLEAFERACERYTRSYVYLCHTPQTGTWLGGTPEILLAGQEGDWRTVALAGTQSLRQGKLPSSWDDKNREEQRIVADYIRTQLGTLGITTCEEGPYTVRAGELAHLRTDFHFTLDNNAHLGDLLELLHPTPAVCGLPKAAAYRFILDNEGYDRRYYSGFIGRIDPEHQTDLYVNLRCMHIADDRLTLYAGGGLLASSILEEEWKEAEDKLQTMNRIIQ